MPIREITPLFRTLRSAGYQKCEHPRTSSIKKCMDCGADFYDGHWIGGHMEYQRLPIQYEVP